MSSLLICYILKEVEVESALLFETPADIYARVFRTLRPRSPLPEIVVEFRPFANPNSYVRLEGRRLHVRMSDLLEGAPAPVIEALAFLLLCKLFRRGAPKMHLHRYRLYLSRSDVRRTIRLMQEARGHKTAHQPRGACYDLEEMFEKLNQRYFHGLMARPALAWTRKPTRTLLGRYDATHNAILLSRRLDSPEVPRLAVEYVLYHEMLHLRFPVEHQNGRRRIHTPEFKAAEKEFVGLAEAKRILKRLI